MQPTVSNSSASDISFVLHSARIPVNAGRIRCPTYRIIVDINPTVSAWRDAPHIPPDVSQRLAAAPKAVATNSHAYAIRMKKGKLEWIPRIFGSLTARSNIRNAAAARLAPLRKSQDPAERLPPKANASPRRFTATADSRQFVRTGGSPRKTDIHFALNPQTNGTRNPHATKTRNRWLNT